ncbi:MAG: ComF family protein [Planctomycetes bacterium]|nr:ComF family protein [Planctomycetota bacterium]
MFELLLQSAVDLVFPPRCVVCDEPGESGDEGLCLLCRQSVDGGRSAAACPRCGAGAAPFAVAHGSCARCRRHSPIVDGTVRVGPYTEALAHMLRAYKFRAQERFEPILGRWLAEAVDDAPWRDDLEAVVPVPAHWTKRIVRPVQVAARIGAVVAKHLGLPFAQLLCRPRSGPTQVGLTYTQRLQNVKGAFRVRRGFKMTSAKLLLVDDVRTTGATLAECARVLRRGGAKRVFAGAVVCADTSHAGTVASPQP